MGATTGHLRLGLGIDWQPDCVRLVTTACDHVLDTRLVLGQVSAADVAAAVAVVAERAPAPVATVAVTSSLPLPNPRSTQDNPLQLLQSLLQVQGHASHVVAPGAALAAGVVPAGSDGLVLQLAQQTVLAGAVLAGRGLLGLDAGHLPVEPAGLPCNCGQRGCLRTRAAGPELVRRLSAYRDSGLSLAGGLALDMDVSHRDRGAQVILRQLADAAVIALRTLVVVCGPLANHHVLPLYLALPRTLSADLFSPQLQAAWSIRGELPLPILRCSDDNTLALGAARLGLQGQ